LPAAPLDQPELRAVIEGDLDPRDAQRVNGFLAGREEGVAVDMNNGLGPGMEAEQDVAHGKKTTGGTSGSPL